MSEIISLLKRESYLQKHRSDFKLKKVESDRCAVIVEPREHELLEAVIRNLMPRLQKSHVNYSIQEWNLHIFCGNKNYEFVKNLLPGWEYEITKLDVDNLNRETYSDLLMGEDFWNKIDAEHILVFQTDCVVFNGFDIEKHLEKDYAYIGSPYNWGPRMPNGGLIEDLICPKGANFNMNGGFSLRKKSDMLECIKNVSIEDIVKFRKENGQDATYFENDDAALILALDKSGSNYKSFINNTGAHEDTYFNNAIVILEKELPSMKDCIEFGFQHNYEGWESAKAVHGYENYTGKTCMQKFCRDHQGYKPKLLFYAGYGYESFNGEDYSGKKGVRGSEIALIKVAEQLTSKYDVYVSGPCISENIYNNVSYFNSGGGKLEWFLDNVEIETVIINRYIHFFLEYTSRAKKHFIWLHDMCYQPFWNGRELPEQGKHLVNNMLSRLNGFICLSDWHIGNIKKLYNLPEEKIFKIGNGIEEEMFMVNVGKIPNRFIYTSLPERGLKILLTWFPDILRDLPNAELHVFTDGVDEDLEATMKAAKNVYYHGKVTYEEMISEFMKADVWLYPNIFLETFCTSALEAQASNCICVTREFGSLGEVVGERGVVVDGDPNSQEFKHETIKKLLNILKDTKEKENLQEKAKKWALQRTWKNRGLEWVDMLSK